ncbi:MAG: methyltransferase domain-containing protein [Actinomycetota bacterium]|jgi:ubiquinone/menaquinone biosynthesis C-methylase UbiE|nr:methyltransferase domain-containing protein [Actinomycetota bacterium]
MSSRAEMLNRKAADAKNKPDQVIECLKIEPGYYIADIGSGGGYYSLRFAEKAGHQGRVYAVDNDKDLLGYVEKAARQKNLSQLSVIWTETGSLPEKALDLIFFRNVTHHLVNRVNYFSNMKKYLKPGGRIAIIDYDLRRFWFKRDRHHLALQTILSEMKQAGFNLVGEHQFLDRQHFTIYALSRSLQPSLKTF